MSFSVPANLEAEIDELITHYPVKRSASLMLLHAIQEHFGWISQEAIEWTAKKLGLTDQCLRVGHLLSDVPAATGWEASDQGLSHVELCARRFAQTARTFLHEAWARLARARFADIEGREVFSRVRGVPGRLRHGSGDDVQRRFLRRRFQQ